MAWKTNGTATGRFVEPIRGHAKPRVIGFRAFQVLAFIRKRLAETGQAPSYTEIFEELGIERHNVSRIVHDLVKRGEITLSDEDYHSNTARRIKAA